MTIVVHAFDPHSRANGPGVRFVVWLQGCTLGCPGCFNPATHDPSGGRSVAIDELAGHMRRSRADGLTLSGGEPLEQAEAACALLDIARQLGWSTLMFSGFTRDEIAARPHGQAVLDRLDVLIDGRYIASERHQRGLRGSANQRIHLLTDRHSLAEVEATPIGEVVIGADGLVQLTGVAPPRVR